MSAGSFACSLCPSTVDSYGYREMGCCGNCHLIQLQDIICSAAQLAAPAPWEVMPSLIPSRAALLASDSRGNSHHFSAGCKCCCHPGMCSKNC